MIPQLKGLTKKEAALICAFWSQAGKELSALDINLQHAICRAYLAGYYQAKIDHEVQE